MRNKITIEARITNALVSGVISYIILGIFFSGMLIDVIAPRSLSMAVFFIISFTMGVVICEILTRVWLKWNRF